MEGDVLRSSGRSRRRRLHRGAGGWPRRGRVGQRCDRQRGGLHRDGRGLLRVRARWASTWPQARRSATWPATRSSVASPVRCSRSTPLHPRWSRSSGPPPPRRRRPRCRGRSRSAESVTGVATGNFTSSRTAASVEPVNPGVSGSGTTWTVTASTGTASGTSGSTSRARAASRTRSATRSRRALPVVGEVYDDRPQRAARHQRDQRARTRTARSAPATPSRSCSTRRSPRLGAPATGTGLDKSSSQQARTRRTPSAV